MEEIWKDVGEAVGAYKISSKGRVYSVPRTVANKHSFRHTRGGIVKPRIDAHGYVAISLNVFGRVMTRKIHRLMAIAFIPNPNNYPEINHIDGNKLNNNLSNLEWCDRSHNNRHAMRTGLRKPNYSMRGKFGEDHNRSKAVRMLDLESKSIRVFGSASEAGRETGFERSWISKACREGRVAYNRRWEYVKEYETKKHKTSRN